MRELHFHFLRIVTNSKFFIDKRHILGIIINMEQNIEKIISQNLIELRKSKNLKQSELSSEIGYSDKTISRWENGTSMPDISTLVKICEFYSVSIEDIIKENAVKKAPENVKKQNTEKMINDYSMMALSCLTVWLVAVLIYVGLVSIRNIYYWQAFVTAVPFAVVPFYKHTRKDYNLKWLNFLLITIIILGLISAIYVIFINYNFWQIFILFIPLEGMGAVYTLFRHRFGIKEKKRKRKKNKDATVEE